MTNQCSDNQNLGQIKNTTSYFAITPNPKSAPISASFGKHMGQAAAAKIAPNDPTLSSLLRIKS